MISSWTLSNSQKFLMMNIIVYFNKKTYENENQNDEKGCFIQVVRESTSNTKLKAFIFEINGIKGFAWIKSEPIVKKTLKD